jgi:hypothetical protein
MVFYCAIISTILIKYKIEETLSRYSSFVKLFPMEKVSLFWEEIKILIIAKCGTHIKDSVTMFQLNSTKHSAVLLDMKSSKKLMIGQRIHVQSFKSAV